MRRIWVVLISLAALVAVGSALAANFLLTKTGETNSTITFSYPSQAGADGYRYYAPGQITGDSCSGTRVSRTFDPSKLSIRFSKVASGEYCVEAIVFSTIGAAQYPAVPAGDTQPPTVPPNLATTAVTQTTVSLAWGDSTDNVGVVNYRVFRNNAMIGEGPGTSGGFTNAWADTGRTCGTTFTYTVDAQDAAGNTSAKASLTVGTAACVPPPVATCADGLDNDVPPDGKIDYPADPGCTSATDNDETDSVTPPGTTITLAQLQSRVNVSGAVVDNVTVTGTGHIDIGASNVTIRNSQIPGVDMDIDPVASGFKLIDSSARSFNIFGADDVLIQGNILDGAGVDPQNLIWDTPASNTPDRFVIRNNTIRNFYTNDPASHSEGLYVGYSTNGLIEGNTFTNNGNTGHIYFTWFGTAGSQGVNPATIYPRNMCVRGNTFNATHGAYYDVQVHGQIPSNPTANIVIQPGASIGTDPDNGDYHGAC